MEPWDQIRSDLGELKTLLASIDRKLASLDSDVKHLADDQTRTREELKDHETRLRELESKQVQDDALSKRVYKEVIPRVEDLTGWKAKAVGALAISGFLGGFLSLILKFLGKG